MSVPVIVVAIVLAFIIPLPSGIIDVLLAVNIMISVIILLNTIYMKEALQMSIFPSLLVITTLFRLALNVSTTRLILGKGKPAASSKGSADSWVEMIWSSAL